MKPKFDINNFESLNNKEIIFECEVCNKEFKSSKKYVRQSLGIVFHPRKPSLKYCSKKCMGEGKKMGKYLKKLCLDGKTKKLE